MASTLNDIEELCDRRGTEQHSREQVTHLEHALQSAWFAEQEGAEPKMITAALLHDLGHLLDEQGESPTLRGIDDLHQFFILPFLRALFDDAVLEPIRWHVDAKRYLCATRMGYQTGLSKDSQRSMVLQGGVFTAVQASEFIARPYVEAAVRLRLWDDLAKIEGMSTPPLAHYLAIAQRCRIGGSADLSAD